MYIEKRKVGKSIKYYLAHSFREGGKMHKVRKFLGINLDPGTLDNRAKQTESLIIEEIEQYKIIKDPLKFELSKKDISFAEGLEKEQELKVFHLSENQWKTFSELFTYNTNAIEGSELNIKEVKGILEKDEWPEKSKKDIAEAYGVNEAIKFIRKTDEHISVDLIKRLHLMIFKNSKKFAGQLRKPGEEVVVRDGLGRIVHYGAPQSRVVGLLNELVEWYNKNKKKYPALILAAVIHNQFENIHPFGDGNGRVGRILLANILIKHGLPPLNIDLTNVREYYSSLQEYQKKGNLRPTLELMTREYKLMKKKLGDYK